MKQALLLAIAAALVALCTVLSPVLWLDALGVAGRASARAYGELEAEDRKWRHAQVAHDLGMMLARTGAGEFSLPLAFCFWYGDEPADGAPGARAVSPLHDFYLLPDAFVGGAGVAWLLCVAHNASSCECVEEAPWTYGERPADFTRDGTLSLLTEGTYSGSTWTVRAPDHVAPDGTADALIAEVWYDHKGALLSRSDVARLVDDEGGEVDRSEKVLAPRA